MARDRPRRVATALLTVWRSFATKLVLLVVVFVAVPAIVYGELRSADQEQRRLLLKSVEGQGRLIAEALSPFLEQFSPDSASRLGESLARLGSPDLRTKVLFRPSGARDTGNFYYVASAPAVSAEYLERERDNLIASGVLSRVRESCDFFEAPVMRYQNPSGQEEVITSLTPLLTKAGCWVVITSSSAESILGSSLGQPYWRTPEIRIAAAIYLLMALFVISLFGDVWRSLRRFASLARGIRTQRAIRGSFADAAVVPELAPVAREFDNLVAALDGSAQAIRFAAEENAHALKTPIGVIAQSMEPLKRAVGNGDQSTKRTIAVIEQSLERLDALVSAARRMDEAAADLLDPAFETVDLSVLLHGLAEDYADSVAAAGKRLVVNAEPASALISEDLFEASVGNLIDNAVDFTPPGGTVTVSLGESDDDVVITVEDEGPGVDPADVSRLFDRYYSRRDEDAEGGHFGIGLWIVRRNVEALRGRVYAENRENTGLCVGIVLPRA